LTSGKFLFATILTCEFSKMKSKFLISLEIFDFTFYPFSLLPIAESRLRENIKATV